MIVLSRAFVRFSQLKSSLRHKLYYPAVLDICSAHYLSAIMKPAVFLFALLCLFSGQVKADACSLTYNPFFPITSYASVQACYNSVPFNQTTRLTTIHLMETVVYNYYVFFYILTGPGGD